MRRVLVLGIGNRFRSDDGVGPAVVDRLRALGIPAEERSGEGAELIDAWQGHDTVIVVDACRSDAAPGTVLRIDAAAEPLPAGLFHYSSHLFGLAEAVETARALGRLPRRLIVFGIEGAAFGFGDSLSPAVETAAGEVVRRVAAEVRASGP
ncbi:hydrogenase maturation protease [Azospirillum sp. RWY-5-1]|uniref:Hydrogenase maturation protease n=1 Tax=Azospirillum oleiclasticum TaxID=2735135 RepID=A0ABX2TIT4_9PROT|nr:hydrogenase maturation protease [Azospirillum oleiclasticum]NYZ16362.1 hydrogenase maturation protease [Azospirillum oleiclasticum]NYZ23922.1 hydrogenase maturation protease [Azospirillum oleiclasticum]